MFPYLLFQNQTPQGIAEKSRLAYQHLSYFTNLYSVARQDYLKLFQRLDSEGVRQIAFCGVDEVAEIAYLSLLETRIRLVTVVDVAGAGDLFFGVTVQSLGCLNEAGVMPIVVSSLKRREDLLNELHRQGVAHGRIYTACG